MRLRVSCRFNLEDHRSPPSESRDALFPDELVSAPPHFVKKNSGTVQQESC